MTRLVSKVSSPAEPAPEPGSLFFYIFCMCAICIWRPEVNLQALVLLPLWIPGLELNIWLQGRYLYLLSHPTIPQAWFLIALATPDYLHDIACAVFAGLARSQGRTVPQGSCGGSKAVSLPDHPKAHTGCANGHQRLDVSPGTWLSMKDPGKVAAS